jgi:hypothetical protein
MPGESMPPEPVPAANDVPAQEPEPTSPAEPSQPAVAEHGAAPADAVQPADFPDREARAQPGPPDTPLDPAAATGPPWPRLVAATGAYTPPRLARWPIIAGVLLFAGWIAAVVAVRVAVSSPSSGYVVTAGDAHFTATFPARPQHAARTVGTTSVIAYITTLSSDAVSVTYIALPASASFSLDGAVNGEASSLPGAEVVSRNSLTYLGQPAEDATITFSAGSAEVRIVRFGSSAYALGAFGPSASSFAHDYNVLIDSFRPLP